jgi:predicted amidohydrolase YtcJ
MKQLSVSPSFLIGHVYYYGQVFRDKILGYERSKLVDPMKSAINTGLIPTIHSDYNCQPIDPLRCMYNAVTRMTR